MTCSHPYVHRVNDGLLCLDCGAVIKPQEKVYSTEPLVMPPFIFQLTEAYWKDRNPWRISRKMALKYRWYGSIIYNREYLVMPIYDHAASSEPVFYSARCLTECETAPKYDTPKDYKRVMWKSWEFVDLSSPTDGDYVLIGEGVADAAWLSQLGPSIALLGSHGELNRPFILVLDGDERGINAAFEIVQEAKRAGLVDAKTVVLPAGADPTDVPVDELRSIIFEQTGVLF